MDNKTTTKLGKSRTLQNKFLDDILETAIENIPSMAPDMKFTLETLFGEELWKTLGDGERRRAGLGMKHLVDTGKLPQLRIADTKHEYPVYYEFK